MKNEWRGSNNLQTEVYWNTKKASGTKPAKDPDEVDKTCVERLDRAAKTNDKELLECPHVLHNMKKGSEHLLGLKTKVSAVKDKNSGSFCGLRSISINYVRVSSKESECDSV